MPKAYQRPKKKDIPNFRQYGDMLAAYKGQWTDIDLTGTLEPPKDLFIDVRVLKDAGEIQTEYGISPYWRKYSSSSGLSELCPLAPRAVCCAAPLSSETAEGSVY
jgi:hypothetical protein